MTPLKIVISKYTFSLITMKIVPSGCQKHVDPVCPLKGISEISGVDWAISQFWKNLQELRDLLIGCDSTRPE